MKDSKFSEFVNRILEELGIGASVKRLWLDYGSQIKKILVLSVVVVLAFAAITFVNGSDEEEISVVSETTDEAIEDTSSNIYIDIGGEVKTPMLAELPAGSRVEDAIQAAGGLTEDADLTSINRAEFLEDGQKIYIPANSETSVETGEISDSGATDQSSSVSTGSSGTSTGKVNINTADLTGLQTLSGVGPVTAQKIIDYRTDNGRFKTIEDLKNVSGIGDKTFEKLKDSITV